MIRPELYHKTVNILFDAYFNDTLEHGNYCGCAVGNIVAANMHKTFFKISYENEIGVDWVGEEDGGRHWFFSIKPEELLCDEINQTKALAQIKSTGYSVEELIKIESAFESADYGVCRDERMFNGLVLVLNALKEIHEVTDDHETNVSRFSNHYKLKVTQ